MHGDPLSPQYDALREHIEGLLSEGKVHTRQDFAYAAPHPDKAEMVSSLEWEAFREGWDDLRYQ